MGSTTIESSRERGRLVAHVRMRVIVVGLLCIAVAGGGWWWTHPDALPSAYGASVKADPRPFDSDAVWVAELTAPGAFPEEGTLTLRSVEVRLDEGFETDAEIEVLRCTVIDTSGGGTLSVGFADDLPEDGHACVPARSGTILDERDQLVAVLRPRGPGRYRLGAATVGYRLDAGELWRTGTQTTKLNVTVIYD